MSGGERTEERPGDSVIRVVREQFGLSLNDVIEGWAGEESVGWRVPSPGCDRFVQRFPRWRRAEELGWCDEVAAAAATQDPACVHAVPTDDGRRAIETSDGPVMVFPFVDGDHPDDHVVIAAEAARLLARIHRGIAAAWTGKRVRASTQPPSIGRGELDPRLRDRELDLWERSIEATEPPLPIHGDYYAGNLFVKGMLVIGVIDWSDARLEHHEQEVAWAMWEFCQNDDGDDLVESDAEAFLQAYIDTGGPASVAPPFDAFPWIRQRLRWEAAAWFSDPRSTAEVSAYHEAQVRAFHAIRNRRLRGRPGNR